MPRPIVVDYITVDINIVTLDPRITGAFEDYESARASLQRRSGDSITPASYMIAARRQMEAEARMVDDVARAAV